MSVCAHEVTYKLSVCFGHEDVHLGALGADDLAGQRVLAQVDVATIGLVDGDGGDLPQHLERHTHTLNDRLQLSQA